MDELLQALRNITREHMRLLAQAHNYPVDETRNVVCVEEALRQLTKHDFKSNNPL